MPTNKLMNAILSMDAYNRGYEAGIELTGNRIGNANIIIDSSELGTTIINGDEIDKHEPIGFYALAYDVGGGNTIISYRGTDCPPIGNEVSNRQIGVYL